MIIDVLLIILMIFAVIKGFRNGFIVAVFSFFGIIIGLAAAMKFSTLVASWIKNSTQISAAWIPFLSFIIIMIVVVLLLRMGAKLIQSTIELALMGWLNKLCGIVLYAILFITVFSVVLFYSEKVQLFNKNTFHASVFYPFIQPWGPKAINLFGIVIPLFKGMFEELSHFFETLTPNAV